MSGRGRELWGQCSFMIMGISLCATVHHIPLNAKDFFSHYLLIIRYYLSFHHLEFTKICVHVHE